MNITISIKLFKGWKRNLFFIKKKQLNDKKSYDDAYKKHAEMLANYHAAKSMNERFAEMQTKRVSA